MMLCEDMLGLAAGGTVGGPLEHIMTQSISSMAVGAAILTAKCLNTTHVVCRRRLSERHFIAAHDDEKMRRICVLCSNMQQSKSGQLHMHHFCRQCGVFLHIDCFKQWHTVLKPVSPRFASDKVLLKVFSGK